MNQLLSLVHKEINRRETLNTIARERKEQIRREYQPLHPELYQFQVKEDSVRNSIRMNQSNLAEIRLG